MEPLRPSTRGDVRLTELPASRRLAVGLFLLALLVFYGLSQVQLIVAVGGGTGYPTPHDVLVKYHGDPTRSRFHKVLDPSLALSDPKNMYQHLSPETLARAALRKKILAWVEDGMPKSEWPAVQRTFTSTEACAFCHRVAGEPEPAKPDLPLETYEQVVAAAGPDTGMSSHDLATSSHNHAMGFAVVALLASLAFTATRWRGPVVPLLVLGSFLGSTLDVASWWLTKSLGHPWEFGVLAGGGLFGACSMTMVVLALDEMWLRGRVGALVEPVVRAARLGRRDPAGLGPR